MSRRCTGPRPHLVLARADTTATSNPLGRASIRCLDLLVSMALGRREAAAVLEAVSDEEGAEALRAGVVCRRLASLAQADTRAGAVLDRALGDRRRRSASIFETRSMFALATIWAEARDGMDGPSAAALLWTVARAKEPWFRRLEDRLVEELTWLGAQAGAARRAPAVAHRVTLAAGGSSMLRPAVAALLLGPALALPWTARAEEPPAAEDHDRDASNVRRDPEVEADDEHEAEEHEQRSAFRLEFEGFGDLQFAFHDFGPNQNREGGSQRDARLVFDDTRFVLAVEGEMPHGISFEAEIEFEHGGTGTAQEIEYEEFGEFEQEIEKGGEVLLEELYVKKTFAERYSIQLGRFYVAMGTLSRFYRPTDYLASTRSEAETAVIPAVWPELGLQLEARPVDWLRVTAQVVNGLDSTGFSSQRWVASGHQSRFEMVRATDLAGVLSVDFLPRRGVELGVSAYYGGTSRNRPKPDLIKDCSGGARDVVAPCGYVGAPLLLLDAHAHFQWGPVRGTALALWGHLDSAAAISSRNDRLSNALNVPRTPVADEALALWAELGLDVAPWLGLTPAHVLEPYVRIDHYDTMFGTREGLFDNPRFERTVVTAGLGYTLAHAVFLKLDLGHRWFGSSALNPESTVRLSTGFVY